MRAFLIALTLLLTVPAFAQDPTSANLWRDLVRSYDKGVRENNTEARHVGEKGIGQIREVRRESDGAIIRVNTHLPKPPITREIRLFGAQLKELAEAKAKPGSTDPAKQAKEILGRQEFLDAAAGRSQKTALERWLEDAFKKIGKWLERLHIKAPGGGNPSAIIAFAETMRFVLYFLIGVGVLVLLYHLVRMARDAGWIRRKKKKSDSATEDPLLDAAIADPISEAQAAEQAGEWRQAVRLHYIAALRLLRERGWLVMEANRTNWEYQRFLHQRNPELARLLLPATRRFDWLWYGKRTATPEDAEAMRTNMAALKDATKEQERPE
ncbi:MAG: DUF4129 domain-containing protein [Armatimonas sp.]